MTRDLWTKKTAKDKKLSRKFIVRHSVCSKGRLKEKYSKSISAEFKLMFSQFSAESILLASLPRLESRLNKNFGGKLLVESQENLPDPPKGSVVFYRPRLFEGWITLRTEQPRSQAVNFL